MPYNPHQLVLVDSFKLTWSHLSPAAGTLVQFDAYVDNGRGSQPYAGSVLFPAAFLSFVAAPEPLGAEPSAEAVQQASMFWRWLLTVIPGR